MREEIKIDLLLLSELLSLYVHFLISPTQFREPKTFVYMVCSSESFLPVFPASGNTVASKQEGPGLDTRAGPLCVGLTCSLARRVSLFPPTVRTFTLG